MKVIFETQRLIVRKLIEIDGDDYFDMMGNPKVMNPLPRAAMSRRESDAHFLKHLNATETSEIKVWAITNKVSATFIGICAFLKNNNNEDEIGYRLREQFWGIGFGTEIVKGLLDYGFKKLNLNLITADVNVANIASVKILEKFFKLREEFYNDEDTCWDRRYYLEKPIDS